MGCPSKWSARHKFAASRQSAPRSSGLAAAALLDAFRLAAHGDFGLAAVVHRGLARHSCLDLRGHLLTAGSAGKANGKQHAGRVAAMAVSRLREGPSCGSASPACCQLAGAKPALDPTAGALGARTGPCAAAHPSPQPAAVPPTAVPASAAAAARFVCGACRRLPSSHFNTQARACL